MPSRTDTESISAADHKMFRRLRAKFVAIIMVTMVIVLAAMFAAICYSEYQRSVQAVTGSMQEAITHAVKQNDENAGKGKFAPPMIGGHDGDNDTTPVAVYLMDETGALVVQEASTTASLSDSVADEAANEVLASDDGSGTLSALRLVYLKQTVNDQVYIAFADLSSVEGWQSLAIRLAAAGAVVLAIVFLTSFVFANWALEPVRAAWSSQRRFVTDASHDLKTPLTVILANASILLKHPERTIASQSQWIESTQVEAENMQGLINEMLELSQVEEQHAAAFSDVDFSDLVDGLSLQFESVAFERECTFDTDIAPDIHVSGSEAHLRKMVTTLIDNALKYADEKGEVSVTLDTAGSHVRLRVHNSGPAIAADDLPHLFDRFYRSDKARTSGEGGFGLGLAIAQETAHVHNGRITVESSDGEGTTFTVTLPQA